MNLERTSYRFLVKMKKRHKLEHFKIGPYRIAHKIAVSRFKQGINDFYS